jgi:hypothetical protein
MDTLRRFLETREQPPLRKSRQAAPEKLHRREHASVPVTVLASKPEIHDNV